VPTRRAFEGFYIEYLNIRYTTEIQRRGRAAVTGELVIMSWEPEQLGRLFGAI
jgi:DNA adenine methylase